jgi:hypothetical protein
VNRLRPLALAVVSSAVLTSSVDATLRRDPISFTAPLAVPLTSMAPLGSLAYTGSQAGKIDFASDIDSYTIALDAGQTLTAVITPTAPNGAVVRLRFAHRNVGDEPNPLPTNFIGSVDGDGVAISTDGVNWFTVSTSDTLTNSAWQTFDVDLVAVAQANGLTLGDNFRVKFVQYDNLGLPSDGRAWDNVQITAAGSSDFYIVPATAGQTVTFRTLTIGDVPGELVNNLDPAIDIVDDQNNLIGSNTNGRPDERNAAVSFTVPATGTYFVRVRGETGTTGEYVLRVTPGQPGDITGNTRPRTELISNRFRAASLLNDQASIF